jgi:flagellar basal body-associated protein FliL
MQNDSKKFKKFKKAPLLLALLFLLVSCGAWMFLYGKIKENKIISEKSGKEWHAEAVRRDEIRSLERSILEIQDERTQVEMHFAQSSNVVPFLDTIEKLATNAGANSEVVSVDVSPEKSELEVALTAQGSFSSIYNFIRLLENSPYEIEIDSFNVEKEMAGEWQGTFTIRLLSFTR